MLLLIMLAGFFILILPMRRQQKQQQQLLSCVKKNDKIITSGGVIGVVVDVRDKKNDDGRPHDNPAHSGHVASIVAPSVSKKSKVKS